MNFKLVVPLALVLITLISCSSGNKSNPVLQSIGISDNSTWSTGCYNVDMFVGNTQRPDDSYQATVSFNGDQMNLRWTSYESTNNCTGSSSVYEIKGTMQLDNSTPPVVNGQPPTTNNPQNSQAIKMSVNSRFYTPNQSDPISGLNSGKVCGFSDWSSGVAKDISAPSLPNCYPSYFMNPWSPIEPVTFIKVQGDQLFLGNSQNQGLDIRMGSVPFKRQ